MQLQELGSKRVVTMQHLCQRWCEGVSALILWQIWRALKAAVLLLCCAMLLD